MLFILSHVTRRISFKPNIRDLFDLGKGAVNINQTDSDQASGCIQVDSKPYSYLSCSKYLKAIITFPWCAPFLNLDGVLSFSFTLGPGNWVRADSMSSGMNSLCSEVGRGLVLSTLLWLALRLGNRAASSWKPFLRKTWERNWCQFQRQMKNECDYKT